MLSVIKWLALLPFQFASTFAAWIVAPIAVLFRHEYSLKGTWFWWTTTPVTDLRGDPDHQEKWNHRNCYMQFVTWIWRNPAVNFQREWLGYSYEVTDEYNQHHKQLKNGGIYKRETIYRNGRLRCWMIYLVYVYPFYTKKAFRFLIGWKTWDVGVKDPLQYTCRITPWKSVD